MPLMGPPEDKYLDIDTVFSNILNAIENHEILLKLKNKNWSCGKKIKFDN